MADAVVAVAVHTVPVVDTGTQAVVVVGTVGSLAAWAGIVDVALVVALVVAVALVGTATSFLSLAYLYRIQSIQYRVAYIG
jgi:energy-converting hydrogenase Eha subunit C